MQFFAGYIAAEPLLRNTMEKGQRNICRQNNKIKCLLLYLISYSLKVVMYYLDDIKLQSLSFVILWRRGSEIIAAILQR